MLEPKAVVAEARPPARRRKLVIGLVAVAILIAAFLLWTRKVSDVPVFNVRFAADPHEDNLVVRYDHRGDLLITRLRAFSSGGPQPIYRYKVPSAEVELASVEEWSSAPGKESRSGANGADPVAGSIWVEQGKFGFISPSGQGRLVSTRGQTALRSSVDPAGNGVAVLTTDGRKRFSTRGWWATFGGGYGGQHYVEIFDAAKDMAPRRAVRIPFTTSGGIEAMTWSEDAK